MKFFKNLIITAVLAAAIVHLGGNYLVSRTLECWLGVSVSVERVRWGFSTHQLIIKNIRLRNPSGYSAKDLAKISEARADYDVSDFLKSFWKIRKLEVDVQEIQFELNSKSETNLLKLHPVKRALHQPLNHFHGKPWFLAFPVSKARVSVEKIIFENKTKREKILENPHKKLLFENSNELLTLDDVALHMVALAFQSQGLPIPFSTRLRASDETRNEMEIGLNQIRDKIKSVQSQLNQSMNQGLK